MVELHSIDNLPCCPFSALSQASSLEPGPEHWDSFVLRGWQVAAFLINRQTFFKEIWLLIKVQNCPTVADQSQQRRVSMKLNNF